MDVERLDPSGGSRNRNIGHRGQQLAALLGELLLTWLTCAAEAACGVVAARDPRRSCAGMAACLALQEELMTIPVPWPQFLMPLWPLLACAGDARTAPTERRRCGASR